MNTISIHYLYLEDLGSQGSSVNLKVQHPDSSQIVGCYSPCSKFYSIIFYFIIVYFIILYIIILCSILFYYIPFYSILFYSSLV